MSTEAETREMVFDILKEDQGIAQALLDLLNTYRKRATTEYTSLAQISLPRLRYWVKYDIASCSKVSDEYSQRAAEIAALLLRVDAVLSAAGVKSDPEGWGTVRHGCKTKDGIFNMRDIGNGKWARCGFGVDF